MLVRYVQSTRTAFVRRTGFAKANHDTRSLENVTRRNFRLLGCVISQKYKNYRSYNNNE